VIGASDVDVYVFQPSVSQTVDIRAGNPGEGKVDAFLRVFDSAGNQLASNDNASIRTTDSFVRLTVQAGQTYYIGVNGAGPGSSAYNPLTGAGAVAGSTGTYTLTVASAPAGQLQFIVDSFRVGEKGRNAVVQVNRVGGSVGQVAVHFATAAGSAKRTDFAAVQGDLVWADGDASTRTIVIPIRNDTRKESDESFKIHLSGATGGATVGASATVTIVDDDTARRRVAFKQAASSAGEGLASLLLKVQLSSPSASAVKVRYQVVGGSAAGADYTLLGSGTLTFAPGKTKKTIALSIANDAAREQPETIFIRLLSAKGAFLGATTLHTVTIMDND
jgi:hypothetical protein